MNTVYSPQQVAKLAIEALEDLKSSDVGITSGITSLDDVMLPFRPGELIVVMGFTSNYKSGFMNWLIKSAIRQCKENEIVIKVTWEDSVEEDTIKWIASDSDISVTSLIKGDNSTRWNEIMSSYAKRAMTPLWIIGHSNTESAKESKSRPRLTMTDVVSACDHIRSKATDNNYKIKMIALDYLQRIRPDTTDGGTKREQMMEAVNKAKDLAISFGCPVILGVQASRQVLERDFKLPRLDDGMETSNIEQSSDKVISLWFPIKSEREGTPIEALNGLQVTKNMLVCGVLKQKMGEAPVVLPLYVDPGKNLIAGLDIQRISFDA